MVKHMRLFGQLVALFDRQKIPTTRNKIQSHKELKGGRILHKVLLDNDLEHRVKALEAKFGEEGK